MPAGNLTSTSLPRMGQLHGWFLKDAADCAVGSSCLANATSSLELMRMGLTRSQQEPTIRSLIPGRARLARTSTSRSKQVPPPRSHLRRPIVEHLLSAHEQFHYAAPEMITVRSAVEITVVAKTWSSSSVMPAAAILTLTHSHEWGSWIDGSGMLLIAP